MAKHSPNAALNKDMTRFALGTAVPLDAERTELTLTRQYAVAPDILWAMLTDPEKTPLWWAKVRGNPAKGSSFDLKWLNVKDEGHGIESDWWNGRVIDAAEPAFLEVSNSMHGTIRMELTATETGSELVFTNIVSVPAEVVLMSLAGWHVHLDHLQEALAGKSVDWDHWWDDFFPCWEKVHELYSAAIN